MNLGYDKGKITLTEEPYFAIQGEGRHVGRRMLFVRTHGCPVGCNYCDSMSTWGIHPFPEKYNDEKYEQQMVEVQARNTYFRDFNSQELADLIIGKMGGVYSDLWITGGEPTLYIRGITQALDMLPCKVFTHLCTSGFKYDEEFSKKFGSITLDLKPPSSKAYTVQKNISKYLNNSNTEIKIAIRQDYEDKKFCENIVKKYTDSPITVQPVYSNEFEHFEQGVTHSEWDMGMFQAYVMYLQTLNVNVRLGVQLHKILNPNTLYCT